MARKGFTDPLFHDEARARRWFEATRWPDGPICPKCGSAKHYVTKKVGVYRCAASASRKDFTVMTGTVMERSHVKFTDWAVAFHMGRVKQKGLLRSPAPPRTWLPVQHRVVHVSPRARSHASRWFGRATAWWRGSGCRSRRNVFRQTGKSRTAYKSQRCASAP